MSFDAMTGSRADDIVGDYFEAEDWGALVDADDESEVDGPPAGESITKA